MEIEFCFSKDKGAVIFRTFDSEVPRAGEYVGVYPDNGIQSNLCGMFKVDSVVYEYKHGRLIACVGGKYDSKHHISEEIENIVAEGIHVATN